MSRTMPKGKIKIEFHAFWKFSIWSWLSHCENTVICKNLAKYIQMLDTNDIEQVHSRKM
jgi:hypothetical protein